MFDIPYGTGAEKINLDVPYTILLPNQPELMDEGEVLARALANPLGKETFAEFAKNSDKILVIVNDATRPTPTKRVLQELRNRRTLLKGRCQRCNFLEICNGNFRARAEAVFGDPWAEDPACYLTEEEISERWN